MQVTWMSRHFWSLPMCSQVLWQVNLMSSASSVVCIRWCSDGMYHTPPSISVCARLAGMAPCHLDMAQRQRWQRQRWRRRLKFTLEGRAGQSARPIVSANIQHHVCCPPVCGGPTAPGPTAPTLWSGVGQGPRAVSWGRSRLSFHAGERAAP